MGGYKEHKIFDMLKRKSIIIRYVIFIILFFIMITIFIIQTTKENEKLNIVYTENSDIGYKVYLKKNDFFETRYLEEDNQYIANLIDYIEADFKYELQASNENINYRYSYKIVAETNVEDKTNKKSLYKYSEDLIEEKENEFNTNFKLKINEPIKIDYNRYNDIIKRFVEIYDLDNSNATLTINMYVNVINEENITSDTPVISLKIPLTTKTVAIDIETNTVNENNVSICTTVNSRKYVFITMILVLIDIYLIVKLAIFINDTKNEKAVYNMRLKKIMANYGSYIQKLNNEFDFENYQILEIKSFEDLLQIRETINKPILMTEKVIVMETYFFIPSENNVYVYELKAGNLRKNKGKRYKTKEDKKEEITI